MQRWWMDFGGSFEAIFRRIRRFILVVWAKNAPEKGPNDTRKTPPIYALHTPRSQNVAGTAKLNIRNLTDDSNSTSKRAVPDLLSQS